MRVSIVVPGRWHAFESAAYYAKMGCLERLVTNYPRFKTRQWGIPDDHVRSLFWHYGFSRIVWKLGGETLDIKCSGILSDLFSRVAARVVGNPDVIHAWSTSASGCLRYRQEKKWKVILDRASAHRVEQDTLLAEEHRRLGLAWPKRPAFATRRELLEYQMSDAILVPSLFVKRSFLKHGVPEEKIALNPLGVSLKGFQPGAARNDKFRVIFAGSLSIRKGIHYLCEAFRLASIPNSELVLVGGETAQTKTFLKLLEPQIICKGHLPQARLAEEYRDASVFVMPSIEEGQAMVQLQALACGLPLICTSNTGGEDLLRAGGDPVSFDAQGIIEFPAGYVVPSGRVDVLANCMSKLAADAFLLDSKRKAALNFRNGEFSWEDHAKRNLKIYHKILAAEAM